MAAAARQFCNLKRIEFAVGAKQQQLRRRLGKKGMVELVVRLEGKAGEIGDVALERAYPALLGHHDRDRLALDKGLLDRGQIVLRRIGKLRAALAEWGLRPEHVAHFAHLFADLDRKSV